MFRLLKLLLLPLKIVLEIVVTLFDMVVSRHIVAAIVVGAFWLPCHFAFHASIAYFIWPTVILGLMLCGLWDGCEIITIRGRLSRIGLVSGRDELWK